MQLNIQQPKTKEDWIFVLDFAEAVREATAAELAIFIKLVLPEKDPSQWTQVTWPGKENEHDTRNPTH